MANYYSMTRSNYFKVQDKDAFDKWCKQRGLEMIEAEMDDGSFLHGFIAEEGITDVYYDDNDEEHEYDIFNDLIAHLAEGEVAVVMTIGHEKMCYLSGCAFTVNSNGDTHTIDLNSIYDTAKKLGNLHTMAEY
jgi:hypothetical protein